MSTSCSGELKTNLNRYDTLRSNNLSVTVIAPSPCLQKTTWCKSTQVWLTKSFERYSNTIKTLSTGTFYTGIDRCKKTVQTQIRLLLKEQSDQDLHCLPFNMYFWMHNWTEKPNFPLLWTIMIIIFRVPIFRHFMVLPCTDLWKHKKNLTKLWVEERSLIFTCT